MKVTDSLDFAVLGLIYAIVCLVFGHPLAEAAGGALRCVGLCTMIRGALDFVRWCRR